MAKRMRDLRTLQDAVFALCEMYGELSVLQAVQEYARRRADELEGEELPNDSKASRELAEALSGTFAAAGRINN